MAEASFQLVKETLLDHLKWLSRFRADPQVRGHMDAIEAVLYKAMRLPMALEVEADLRRRLEAAEERSAMATALGPMLSYCRACECRHYPELCRLGCAEAPARTLALPGWGRR